MAGKPRYNAKQTAAHYRGVAAGAKRMNAMGRKTASGGKPPKKPGCLVVLFLAGAVLYGIGVVAYNVVF